MIPVSLCISIKTNTTDGVISYKMKNSIRSSAIQKPYFNPFVKLTADTLTRIPGSNKQTKYFNLADFKKMMEMHHSRLTPTVVLDASGAMLKNAAETGIIDNNIALTIKELFPLGGKFYDDYGDEYTITGVLWNRGDWAMQLANVPDLDDINVGKPFNMYDITTFNKHDMSVLMEALPDPAKRGRGVIPPSVAAPPPPPLVPHSQFEPINRINASLGLRPAAAAAPPKEEPPASPKEEPSAPTNDNTNIWDSIKNMMSWGTSTTAPPQTMPMDELNRNMKMNIRKAEIDYIEVAAYQYIINKCANAQPSQQTETDKDICKAEYTYAQNKFVFAKHNYETVHKTIQRIVQYAQYAPDDPNAQEILKLNEEYNAWTEKVDLRAQSLTGGVTDAIGELSKLRSGAIVDDQTEVEQPDVEAEAEPPNNKAEVETKAETEQPDVEAETETETEQPFDNDFHTLRLLLLKNIADARQLTLLKLQYQTILTKCNNSKTQSQEDTSICKQHYTEAHNNIEKIISKLKITDEQIMLIQQQVNKLTPIDATNEDVIAMRSAINYYTKWKTELRSKMTKENTKDASISQIFKLMRLTINPDRYAPSQHPPTVPPNSPAQSPNDDDLPPLIPIDPYKPVIYAPYTIDENATYKSTAAPSTTSTPSTISPTAATKALPGDESPIVAADASEQYNYNNEPHPADAAYTYLSQDKESGLTDTQLDDIHPTLNNSPTVQRKNHTPDDFKRMLQSVPPPAQSPSPTESPTDDEYETPPQSPTTSDDSQPQSPTDDLEERKKTDILNLTTLIKEAINSRSFNKKLASEIDKNYAYMRDVIGPTDAEFLTTITNMYNEYNEQMKEKYGIEFNNDMPKIGGAADPPAAAPITYDPTKAPQQPFFMPIMYQPEPKPEYTKRRVYKEKLGTCYYVPVTLQLHKGALSPEDVKKLQCHQRNLEMKNGINVLLGRPTNAIVEQPEFETAEDKKQIEAAKPPSMFNTIKNNIPSFGAKPADAAAPAPAPAPAPAVPHGPPVKQNIQFGLAQAPGPNTKGGSRKRAHRLTAKTHKRTKVTPDIINLLIYRNSSASAPPGLFPTGMAPVP